MSDAWSQAERVLCVRLDNMGDVLMTTPRSSAVYTSPGAVCTRFAPSAAKNAR
jgi:hypothetical protein